MLKAGDFVQCKKSEMLQYSLDLDEMGVYNDFVFEPVPVIQIMGPWLDPEVELPAEDGVFHFALVNGREHLFVFLYNVVFQLAHCMEFHACYLAESLASLPQCVFR